MRARTAARLHGPPALALALLAAAVAPASAHPPLEGTLTGVHADYFDARASQTSWQLDTGQSTVPVLPTRLPALAPGRARVAIDDPDPGGQVVGPVSAAAPQPAPTLGGRKLAVIVFNFTSSTSQPWTAEQVRQRVFTGSSSTSAFFREESYDRLWLTGGNGNVDGDVYGWYTLDTPTAGCPYGTWASHARNAAAQQGFNPLQYQHVMYVFPRQPSCDWAGLAYMPGTESWINGDLTVRVTAHELGHNLGLHHAGSWRCTGGSGQAVAISSSCILDEYNDPFDVMGAFGSRHSHGWHLQRLGLLQSSNVQTVTQSGTYTMTSALAPTSQPTTLRIPRTVGPGGGVQDWYYLETRESGGVFDNFVASDPVVRGVSIRVNDNPTMTTRSRLVDTHPGGSVADAALLPGEGFGDGQVSVRTVSAGGGDATVEISLGPEAADVQPPSSPAGLSHALTPAGLRLQWQGSTDDVGVSGYSVHRDGVQVGSSAITEYEDAGVPAGPHVYTVHAQDEAGNVSASSAPYTVTVPAAPGRIAPIAASGGSGPIAPLAPIAPSAGSGDRWKDRSGPRLRLSRRRLRNGRVLLTARARDRAGVARVELWVDGRRVRSARAPRVRYRSRLRAGRHRIVAKAVDAKGNTAKLRRTLRVVARG